MGNLLALDGSTEEGMSALKSSAHGRSPVPACRRSGKNGWGSKKNLAT
jgi:hypothetical protein